MLKNCENVTWKNFFFSGNGKKMREKRKKRYKKKMKWMNLFIMMVEEQNMSREIYK